jgi:hypothetical protein
MALTLVSLDADYIELSDNTDIMLGHFVMPEKNARY